MRSRLNPRGYTILEVMIFVGISGVMFLMAATFVNGKQGTAEFRQGMNSLNTDIQQIINNVNDGFYPSTEDFDCKTGGGGPPVFTGSKKNLGTNVGCVFLGEVVQLGVGGDRSLVNVYPVAGRQYVGKPEENQLPKNFSEANPRAIPFGYNLTDRQRLEHGTMATAIYDESPGYNQSVSAFGFFTGLASYNSKGELQSGSQAPTVVVLANTKAIDAGGESEGAMNGKIDSAGGVVDANVRPNPNIIICLDGGRGRYGTLTIGGGNGQRLTTSIKISSSPLKVNGSTTCPTA